MNLYVRLESPAKSPDMPSGDRKVYGVAVTGDGSRVVSASEDGTVKVWDVETRAVVAGFTCDGAARCCTWVGPDKIFVGSAGGRLYWLRLEMQPAH